ncbi:hypothetical protein SAMN05421538_11017 [Paracoccus isoporae]|uniref:DUF2497 domain-containing protein n=1 Tax=Paracoccus isoporae TaxID=591205 RepID=A0A1G7F6E5_9RHOB|nr:hypothetical protein [Paracoccus isoporae]SDE71175.1 hypothetical protein SAMN05421538_11017 [Paracoccus isoporae]
MAEAHAALPQQPQDIGDVLASIRRLIAQDEADPDDMDAMCSEPVESGAPLFPAAASRADDGDKAEDGHGADATPLPGRPLLLVPDPTQALHSAGQSDMADAGARDLAVAAGPPETGDHPTPACRTAKPIASGPAPDDSMTLQETTEMMLTEYDQPDAGTAPVAGPGFDLFASDTAEDRDAPAGGDMLRSLVRDVIRQELHGELGERISRNLRRAIRQEVAGTIAEGLGAPR